MPGPGPGRRQAEKRVKMGLYSRMPIRLVAKSRELRGQPCHKQRENAWADSLLGNQPDRHVTAERGRSKDGLDEEKLLIRGGGRSDITLELTPSGFSWGGAKDGKG
jgi:hypothetical protein